jgi:SNF2 family DNA or RNA helicase/predicted RNA methylase
MTLLILDDASNGLASDLQRLKLAKEAKTLLQERKTLTAQTADVMRALKIGKRLRDIALALGVRPAPAPALVIAPTPRTEPTAEFYPEEGKRTLGQRQKDNNAAIALIARIKAGEVQVTDAERAILAKYSGNGGGLRGADGQTGSPHEYYTPKPVAAAMWNLLGELGFNGGTVLDPSAGTGVFTATRPTSAVMTQVELDETSGSINAAINDGPTVATTVSPFEAVAAGTPDEIYDAIITNVPFGDHSMRGEHFEKDKRFQKANLQEYFILRSLQKLKPNGLAAFIVPKSIMSGKSGKETKLRLSASMMAEFVGAYRLPNSIFTTAAADVTTDLIVFRKFSRAAAEKISELESQSPDTLRAAGVLWDEFLDGRYFAGAGHKYILGEEGTTKGKYGEVAAVINDDTIANIAKMIRRFPDSRIDWELLNTTETAPIAYAEGDVIHSNGQTLEMRDGQWVALDSSVAEDRTLLDLGTKVQLPIDVVNAGVTWEQARAYMEFANNRGSYSDVPAWLVATRKAIDALGEGEMQPWFEAISAGMAVMQLAQAAESTEPFNYKDAYPVLSALLARVQSYGNKSIGRAPAMVKDALQSIRVARLKGEYTAFWTGEIQANVQQVALTPTQLYEKVRYEAEDETGYVSADKLREAFSDFDPLTSDEWCIAADGTSVMHANDYYTGNYGDFLANANAELEAATDPAVRAKIVRQIEAAKERINVVDVSKMTFNLFTPHVSNLQKLEFLKQYVSEHIFLTTDAEGRETFDIKQPGLGKWANKEETAEYKALQRFVKGYLKNQNITTMSKGRDVEDDPEAEAALLRRIKEVADKAKANFDAWARANDQIQVSLHNKLNSPEALRFIEEPDGTPLNIPNLNTITFKPHAYQYAAARRYARHFAGVLGFDVGLGKTLTALASVQYAQSIGVKKKTIFVVPNATLTNWKKEAGKAYLDTSDCLFVGVVAGKSGKDKVDNAQVKIDLNVIRENRHAKVFMTLEAFKLIPLRDETMEAYISYLQQNDDAYLLAEKDAEKKRANIAAANKAAGVKDVGAKSGALPYFEDMGVDSLVLDEAHNYKNSKMTSSAFVGAKYLADPSKSQRGMDMQAKAWFVRGLTARNDGVVSLTATPVTNSPLEVYAMLTLAMGEREVNAMYGVTGADSFMAGACDMEEREEENIVGIMRSTRVFTGLQNAGLLRRLLQTSALIKTADDVKADGIDISVPEYEEIATGVDIGADAFAQIIGFKDEYLKAMKEVMAGGADPETKLKASPFNLIRKMTKVINDPELDSGIITFKYAATDADAAQKAIDAFNKKNIVEERDYLDPNASPDDMKTKLVKDTETGDAVSKFLITVRARRAARGNAVELLSTDYDTQDVLLKLLATNGIEPTVKISPKLAAVLENVKQESLHPRHMGQAKQIIFCDELSLHHKIKLALTQSVGVPAAKIKVVNAVSVDVAGMQDVQDGFNADGEDNKYLIVIANKKAEVGINLQKGTQAIHHMTIGWTPDSIHQRNGRGVRQGNPVDSVRIYHYDADGTFDAYKRKLVGIKADWIGALMQGDSSKIKIDGDMSKADYELLASAVGDAGAMERINEEISARGRRVKQDQAKASQIQSAYIMRSRSEWLEKFAPNVRGDEAPGFSAWVNAKNSMVRDTKAKINGLTDRIDKSESTLTVTRLGKQRDELKALMASQAAVLAGLPTDSQGTIIGRREYQSITDADKETVAYANWKKDVQMAERMRDEAGTSFRNLSDTGFTGATLDALRGGDAQIIGKEVVVIGSFVEYKNALLVVTKPRLARGAKSFVGFDPADLTSEVDLMGVTGATFIERGTPAWSEAVKRAVAIDEATIAGNPNGFSADSVNLYATYVSDVREGISVPIPSASIDRDSFVFKAPLFPFALEEDAEGGPLIDKIKAEQVALLSKGSGYNTVRVADMRAVEPARDWSVASRAMAVREYCIAHKLRATEQDLTSISSRYLSVRQVANDLGLADEFFRALPEALGSVGSPEVLDAWALAWFNAKLEWVEVSAFEPLLGYNVTKYRDAQNQIDDGRERWVIVREEARYATAPVAAQALKTAIAGGWKIDEILDAADGYGSYIPSSAGVTGADWASVVFEDTGDYIELKVGADQARGAMNVPKTARLYADNWGDAATFAMGLFGSKWREIVGWAKAAKAARALESTGVDLAGMLSIINKQPGVIRAYVGTEDVLFTGNKYNRASYRYESGKYILLALVFKGAASNKIAQAGAAGLQGRTYDETVKAFRINVESGATFSDGKPVASIAALFEHLGIKVSDYQL